MTACYVPRYQKVVFRNEVKEPIGKDGTDTWEPKDVHKKNIFDHPAAQAHKTFVIAVLCKSEKDDAFAALDALF